MLRRSNRLPWRRLPGGGAPVPVPIALGASWWFDADSNVTASSGRVSSWVDRIAGYDAVQAVSGQQPLYSVSSPNVGNRASLFFDNTRPDFMEAAVPLISVSAQSQGLAYYDGGKPKGAGTFVPLAVVGNGFVRVRVDGLDVSRWQVRDGAGAVTSTLSLADAFNASFSSGACEDATGSANISAFNVQGLSTSGGGPFGATPWRWDVIRLGAVASSGTLAWTGEIRHALGWSRALTAAEFAVLDAWLLSEVS